MSTTNSSYIQVLLVEDNVEDALLTKEALQDSKLKIDLHHVEDGRQALSYLAKEVPDQEALTPDLILLDLNMPRMDGREFLKRIKKDAGFQ